MNRGLAAEVLLTAGILRDPNDPAQALMRAKGLVQRGYYREAFRILGPHLADAAPELRLSMTDVVAECAMAGVVHDWQGLLEQSLAGHRAIGNAVGAARARRNLGEMSLAVGRLGNAETHLREAAAAFAEAGLASQATLAECLRARGLLRAGFAAQARSVLDDALRALSGCRDAHALALAHLERAPVLATCGDASGAAKDLVQAERVLVPSGRIEDAVRVRIVAAETLLWSGAMGRAAYGLKGLLADIVEIDDVATQAAVQRLLGQALLDTDPASARQFLVRGRHLYETLGFHYFVTATDIALARVEKRLGLDADNRLAELGSHVLAESPLLSAHRTIARAEICPDDPARARADLLRVRAFAAANANRALTTLVDRVLRAQRLVLDHEPDSANRSMRAPAAESLRSMCS